MKIWISGPVFDIDNFNLKAFNEAARWLGAKGHRAYLPQDVAPHLHEGEPCPPGSQKEGQHHPSCFMRTRVPAMMACDAVLMMPRWSNSRYARAERRMAVVAGMKVYEDTYSVPSATPPMGYGDMEIIAELRSLEMTPAEDGPAEAYAKGRDEGEDMFWRKLAAALIADGVPREKAASKIAELAHRDLFSYGDHRKAVIDESNLDKFADSMVQHGRTFMDRAEYRGDEFLAANSLLGEMVLYVTGKTRS